MFHLEDYNKASWFQNFIASIAGASASLLVSAPLDVIKTRIQNRNFDNPESGFRILSNMARKEGFSSFFKGLVPKVRHPDAASQVEESFACSSNADIYDMTNLR